MGDEQLLERVFGPWQVKDREPLTLDDAMQILGGEVHIKRFTRVDPDFERVFTEGGKEELTRQVAQSLKQKLVDEETAMTVSSLAFRTGPLTAEEVRKAIKQLECEPYWKGLGLL